MAYDQGLAQTLRVDLAGVDFTEKKMFGGLAFLMNGHMICGLHKAGSMYRVGKDSYETALRLPGVQPMMMGARPMAAMVEMSLAESQNDALRAPVLALALATVRALPPKVAKPRKG